MNTVNYLYNMDQKVKTPFGEEGIVSMLAYDDGGNQYFVKTAKSSDWFKEAHLTKAD